MDERRPYRQTELLCATKGSPTGGNTHGDRVPVVAVNADPEVQRLPKSGCRPRSVALRCRSRRTVGITPVIRRRAAGGRSVHRHLAGSQVARDAVPSAQAYLVALRQSLVDRGIIVPNGEGLKMGQDYTFDSPSTAAGVVLGRSSNGRVEWKDAGGLTLKQLQAAAVDDGVP